MSNKNDPILLLPNVSPAIAQKMSIRVPLLNSPTNLSNVRDFSNVCRTCATITEFVMPIFSGEGLQNDLADKIKRHLPIQVQENDELPLVVCYQCSSTLLAWHELVKCSIQADAALRAKISSQQKTNPPNIPVKSSSSVEEEAQSKTVMPEESAHEDDKTKVEIIEKPEFTTSENGKRYAKCGVCYKIVSLGGWTRHMRAHRGERRHSCHTCGLAFNDSGNLARHTRAIHSKQRPHACPTCPKTFSRKSHLEDHVKSHSESRAFVCDICGKGSKSSAALRMHARTHDACRFPCVQCGARFKRRGELNAHMSVHTGEKAHVCHCGKTFRLRSQLTAHTRVHQKTREQEMEKITNASNTLGLKPEFSRPQPQQYRTCVYCASTHPVASYRKHLVVEHSHRLFHCEECDTFVDRKDFVVHMSFHALHYTTKGVNRKKFKKKEDIVRQIPSTVPPARASQCPLKTQSPQCAPKTENPQASPKTQSQQCAPKTENPQASPKTESSQYAPKIESKPIIKIDKNPPVVVKTKTSVQENEFSDHSDMDEFEPLPESVFEAIEDSQDGQHLADNSTHAPEPHRDKSKISSQPENDNLSTPAPSLEKKYKFNNCSVVINPINIYNCAQMNIAIKNNKVNNNPANKTPPKTTDASTSGNHPTDEKEKRNQKIRKCPFCPKECRAASSYFYHLKYVHKQSKEHECEVCGRKFNTRSCLTQHMAIHAAQYEFECQQCPKQFKTKASLYIHEQTHNGKKLWPCSHCETSFRWKTQLQRHMKRHAAEKGHVCDTCGRGFSVRSDLLRHARTHTAGNFTCDKCGQKFAQLRYLKVHTTKQHSTNVRKGSK